MSKFLRYSVLALILVSSLDLHAQDKTAEDYYKSGTIKMEAKDYAGAILDFTRAIEMDPNNEYFYEDRANVQIMSGNYKSAIDDFSKLIELDRVDNPDDPDEELYYQRGVAKILNKDYRGAIEDLNKAIKIDSEYDEAYYNRGFAKYCKNDRTGSDLDLKKAIALNPEETDYESYDKYTKKLNALINEMLQPVDVSDQNLSTKAPNANDEDTDYCFLKGPLDEPLGVRASSDHLITALLVYKATCDETPSIVPLTKDLTSTVSNWDTVKLSEDSKSLEMIVTKNEVPVSKTTATFKFDETNVLSLTTRVTSTTSLKELKLGYFTLNQIIIKLGEDNKIYPSLTIEEGKEIGIVTDGNLTAEYTPSVGSTVSFTASEIKMDDQYSSFDINILIKNTKPDKPVLDEDIAKSYYDSGTLNIGQKKYAEAIVALDNAIKLDDDNGLYYCARGQAKIGSKDNLGAEVDLRKGLMLGEVTADSCFYYGLAEYLNKEYTEAEKYFNKAIGFDASRADAYYYRGNVKYINKDLTGAADDLKKATELDPATYTGVSYEDKSIEQNKVGSGSTNAEAKTAYESGLAKMKMGANKSAIIDFNKAIALDANYAEAYTARGQAKKKAGVSGGDADIKKGESLKK